MKTWSILPFAVLGILLALMLAVSACDDDEPDDDGPGDSNTPVAAESPAEFSMKFGGPYPFAPKGEKAGEKERDFECYKEIGRSLSKAVPLKDGRLEDSIRRNRDFNREYDTQKYNYVIRVIDQNDKNGEIIVAQWESGARLVATEVSQKCQGRQCREDSMWNSGLGDANIMVNLFPEDKKKADPRKSPCWLDANREAGLLDAISKHFMLAQGAGRTIEDFARNRWYEWRDVKVLYAGEFFVDAQRECISDVNGDSGTYRPETSYRLLKKVWDYFREQLPTNIC